MNNKIIIGAVLLPLLASVIAVGHVQEAVALKGHVEGPQKEPKRFVSVTLEGPGLYSAMTNNEGDFNIREVLSGKYTIKIRKGKFVSKFVDQDVSSGEIKLKVDW